MNKTTKKAINEESDRLHKKFPQLTYEAGFGLLYFIAIAKICDGKRIKDSTIAEFVKAIGAIDIDDNMTAFNGLSVKNADTNRRSMRMLIGEDLVTDIIDQSNSYWGHFREELEVQLQRIYFDQAYQMNFI